MKKLYYPHFNFYSIYAVVCDKIHYYTIDEIVNQMIDENSIVQSLNLLIEISSRNI